MSSLDRSYAGCTASLKSEMYQTSGSRSDFNDIYWMDLGMQGAYEILDSRDLHTGLGLRFWGFRV